MADANSQPFFGVATLGMLRRAPGCDSKKGGSVAQLRSRQRAALGSGILRLFVGADVLEFELL